MICRETPGWPSQNSVWRTNSLRQDRPDAETDRRNHITLFISYSCPGGPALLGTTHFGPPRCLQRWQSSRCGYKALSCACSWNLPACWCWSKSPGSGLFWAQVIYCGISSRSRSTQVERDHAPRPPWARKIAGALIYACGDTRFSVHLHSSAARLLGSPLPKQASDGYYKQLFSGGKIMSMRIPHLSIATTSLVLPAFTFKCPACVRRRRMGRISQANACFGFGIILWIQQPQEDPRTERAQRPPPLVPQPSPVPKSNHGAVQLLKDVSSTCLRLPIATLYSPLSD